MIFFFLLLSLPIFSKELLIEGDRIEYRDGLISASSKTTLVFEDIKITSDAIEIKDDEILCFSGYLSTENFQFFGKKIKKEKNRITIENGWFSTCPNRNPHYRLSSKNITIGPKIVRASNITLRIGNFPIFYIPFYSYPLKAKDSPYSIGIGRSDSLGIFVKTRYNYSLKEKQIGFLLDYYQKKGAGFGIESQSFLGYSSKERYVLDSFYKKKDGCIRIEKSFDRLVSYDYLKGEIKDKTKSYFMLEKSGSSSLGRIVFEEDDYFSKKTKYIPKGNLFFRGTNIKGVVASLDISGENVKEDIYSQNFTINPRISKQIKIGGIPFLQTFDFKVKDGGSYSLSSLSNIRLQNKNVKFDLGYLREDKEDRIPFLIEGFLSNVMGSIEGEFLLKDKEFDNIMFLFSTKKGRFSFIFDGRYKNDRINASLNMGFQEEKYAIDLFWEILEKKEDFIASSIFLRKSEDFSFKLTGYNGGEDYVELLIMKALHCVNLDFKINTKGDFGLNLNLK
ncbi:MAG: hypothetical protein AB1397_04795 [bacterium]